MTVDTERRGRVLVVTLRREEKRNAIDGAMALGIDDALNTFEDDPDLWVAVLTGGPAMFSAGSDLRTGSGEGTARGGEYGVIRRERTKPLVAAVEGLALGGGMEIVLACDLVVASTSATFGLPEVQRGLIPLYGGLFRPAKSLPLNVVKELLLTGDPLDATRAHALGLVNVLTPEGAALDEAVRLAERICTNAPVALRESLRALERFVGGDDELGWSATADAAAAVFASEDAREGRDAFLERRPPRWRGR